MLSAKYLIPYWRHYIYFVDLEEFTEAQMKKFIVAVYSVFEKDNVATKNLFNLLHYLYRNQTNIGISEFGVDLSFYDVKKRFKLIGESVFGNALWVEERGSDTINLKLKGRISVDAMELYVNQFYQYVLENEYGIVEGDTKMVRNGNERKK